MEIPHQMTTLSHIMEKMRKEKTDNEFVWTDKGLSACAGKVYKPEDLEIIKIYRFEEITDPSDMSILYILEAKDGQRGYRLDPYGTYSAANEGAAYYNFMRLIPLRGHESQVLFTL